MFNRILVPLDGSKRAEAIMGHVQEMASRYDATVVLMSVVEPYYDMASPYAGVPTYEFDISGRRKDVQLYLEKWQNALTDVGIESEAYAEIGPPVSTILAVAERENANLIAMSSHGRTGLARAFYGSVAAGILHQTNLPLLLIRAQQDS